MWSWIFHRNQVNGNLFNGKVIQNCEKSFLRGYDEKLDIWHSKIASQPINLCVFCFTLWQQNTQMCILFHTIPHYPLEKLEKLEKFEKLEKLENWLNCGRTRTTRIQRCRRASSLSSRLKKVKRTVNKNRLKKAILFIFFHIFDGFRRLFTDTSWAHTRIASPDNSFHFFSQRFGL